MKVQFITDSKINNNWVMRKSAILKAKGHNCSFVQEDPDKVFISCVFPQNKGQYEGIANMYRSQGIDVEVGGTGFNYDLDPEVDTVMPDYDLYPSEYSIGHTTRGCPNSCHFCIVPKKEGSKTYKVQHIKEFHNPDHNTVMILDSNILDQKEWFLDNMDYVIENKLQLWEHGMDARLLDDEIAQKIKEVCQAGGYKGRYPKFAFDRMSDKDQITEGMKILRKYKIWGSFYIYCHNEAQIDDAIARKEIVQNYKQHWHVMTNQEVPQTRTLKLFKKWGCRPAISRSHSFYDWMRTQK